MNNSPKISIVVPVYNVEPYLAKCINSIVAQTYQNIEILIVNDGSEDGGWVICERAAANDDRIRLFQHDCNKGLSAARNTAIDYATGDYIGFVDSDDFISPYMYERLIKAITKNDSDIAVCGYNVVNEGGKIISKSIPEKQYSDLSGDEKINYIISTSDNCTWNKLYRANVFASQRFPEGKTFEDIHIMHEVFDKAKQVCIIPDLLYYYLVRASGITLRPFRESNFDIVDAYIKRLQYVIEKYPDRKELMDQAGRYLVDNFVYCINRSYKENMIDECNVKIFQLIQEIRLFDWDTINLRYDQKNTLRIILSNLDVYKFALKRKNSALKHQIHAS